VLLLLLLLLLIAASRTTQGALCATATLRAAAN
jgi:hypothetical protein